MSAPSQSLTLWRTYTAEAGSSPTRITASPGVMPRARNAAALRATSARTRLASALPSINCAVMRGLARGAALAARDAAGCWQSTLGRDSGRAQRDLQQIGHRVGVELLHDVGAVRLHRLDAD